jgi:hypothetical protein
MGARVLVCIDKWRREPSRRQPYVVDLSCAAARTPCPLLRQFIISEPSTVFFYMKYAAPLYRQCNQPPYYVQDAKMDHGYDTTQPQAAVRLAGVCFGAATLQVRAWHGALRSTLTSMVQQQP